MTKVGKPHVCGRSWACMTCALGVPASPPDHPPASWIAVENSGPSVRIEVQPDALGAGETDVLK